MIKKLNGTARTLLKRQLKELFETRNFEFCVQDVRKGRWAKQRNNLSHAGMSKRVRTRSTTEFYTLSRSLLDTHSHLGIISFPCDTQDSAEHISFEKRENSYGKEDLGDSCALS